MAQVLSVLAISTKIMKERRISELCDRMRHFSADDEIETCCKRVVGRTDVEDALLRLDTLTKEENLMATARTLEVTHHVYQGTKHQIVFIHFIDIISGLLSISGGKTSRSVALLCCCRLRSRLKLLIREAIAREAPIMALSS
jgi:hypothetical protein